MSTNEESKSLPVTADDGELRPAVPVVDDEKEPKPLDPADVEKVQEEFQEKAKTYLIEQSRHVVVPSFSRWFDFNSVHSIEKKLFPDFFSTKISEESAKPVYKTPKTYREIRDFMINTYRLNPIEYLTVTAVRRNVVGDVASIIRIHRFLEQWGLINYQIDPRTKPSLVGPQFTGHFQLTLDTPKGLTPFIPDSVGLPNSGKHEGLIPKEGRRGQHSTVKNEIVESIPLNIEASSNVYEDNIDKKSAPSIQFYCNESANDVTNSRYHNLKAKSLNGAVIGPLVISKELYDQGLFPLNFVASDFVKLSKSTQHSIWSQQEILLLLEGIEMYGSVDPNNLSLFINNNGQWDRISEHVASKSREECLIKFMQLPIEESHLSKIVKDNGNAVVDKGLGKDEIIEEVVKKLSEKAQGKDILANNATAALKESEIQQTSLVNQAIELTLEKVNIKLELMSKLESELVRSENLLNLQRQQLLVERWLGFEKVRKFKEQSINPDLNPLLDELLRPVSINEINESFNKVNLDKAVDITPELGEPIQALLPVSVAEPEKYQFWST